MSNAQVCPCTPQINSVTGIWGRGWGRPGISENPQGIPECRRASETCYASMVGTWVFTQQHPCIKVMRKITSSTTHIDVCVPSMWFPQGQEIMKAESQAGIGKGCTQRNLWTGLEWCPGSDRTRGLQATVSLEYSREHRTDAWLGWEQVIWSAAGGEKLALTVESFQVPWNGLYAVGNEVGLNTEWGEHETGWEGRSLDRLQALRLEVRRGDCGRGVLPEGGPN